jgi:ubiquinone/menaquinone biosynthesis C-methylase UbiE
MERLDLSVNSTYSALEDAIHLTRYSIIKNICKNKQVLDLACGEGYGSYLIKTWGADKVLGVDISKDTVIKAKNIFAKKINNLKYEEANACNLEKIADNSFNMIVSFETFEHVENVESFLKEIKRVSTKNGIIIISCPNDYMYYPTEKESNPYHKKKYMFEEFKDICEKYLGKANKYLGGFPCRGYINCSIDKKNLEKSQIKMLDLVNVTNSSIIPSDSNIEMNNSSYYIGIWGTNEELSNIVEFPISMEDVPKDFFVNVNEINNLKNVVDIKENRIEELQNEIVNLKKEIENQKFANDALNKELNFTRDNSYKVNEKLKEKEEEIYWINKSRAYKISKKISRIIKK